eukprot:3121323-Pyramimonas_sp.AAC.1
MPSHVSRILRRGSCCYFRRAGGQHTYPPPSRPLITQSLSHCGLLILRRTPSDPPIAQDRSSPRRIHYSDLDSLIAQTHSSLRLTHAVTRTFMLRLAHRLD